MWTTIRSQDFEELITKYPTLEPFANDIILYTFERKGETYHILPRLFKKNFPLDKYVFISNSNFKPREVEFNIKYKPREEQIPILSTLMSKYKTNNILNGIIHARMGIGKTYISIYLAHKMRYVPLVVVDGNNLIDQWTDQILYFTDLKEDDIGVITSKKLPSPDKKFYLTLIQTLLAKIKNNPRPIYDFISSAGINIVIYDECHTTSSEREYAKGSILFDTLNVLGLSATPYLPTVRKQILLTNTIGDIICSDTNYDFIPIVRFYYYSSNISSYHKNKILAAADRNRSKAMYSSLLHKMPNYLDAIYRIVNRIIRDPDRRVLIICMTINQLTAISEYLSTNGIENRQYFSRQRTVDKTKDRVIIATYKYGSKAFDYKEVTDLVLASPFEGKISLIQSSGRILRKLERKKQPIVHDLIDTDIPDLFNIYAKRNIFIKEFGNPKFESISIESLR